MFLNHHITIVSATSHTTSEIMTLFPQLPPEFSLADAGETPLEKISSKIIDGNADVLIARAGQLPYPIAADLELYCLLDNNNAAEEKTAIVGRKNDTHMKDLFSSQDVRRNYGKVTLVGFGPGNADLLTIGGEKALTLADEIYHDDLIDQAFLQKYAARKIYVGKRKGKHSHHQNAINELLYQAAARGQNVVRLKGGDPMVFAHGREEIDYLQSRFVNVEVIPGITAGTALSAFTHIPLTHRSLASSVAFVTGHFPHKLAEVKADTLLIYMGGANVTEIANTLIGGGRSGETPAALVYNVSLPDQKTYFSTLGELKNTVYDFPTPVLIIVGEVVALERDFAPQPQVLVTGTVAGDYKEAGRVTHTPLIRIEKSENSETAHFLSQSLRSFDQIIFTSRYGVRYFFEILDDARIDFRSLAHIKIASVGKSTTAELKIHHLYPDTEATEESAEGLLASFKENGSLKGKNILLPRSEKGLKSLPDKLRAWGNTVTDLPVYTNTPNGEAEKVDISQFQKIIFSSPSCVEAFKKLYGKLPADIQLVAKGITTQNKIKKELQ